MEQEPNDLHRKSKYGMRLHVLCFAVSTTLLFIDFTTSHSTPLRLVSNFIAVPIMFLSVGVSDAVPSLWQDVVWRQLIFFTIGAAYLWFVFLPLRWLSRTKHGLPRLDANRGPLLVEAAVLSLNAVIAVAEAYMTRGYIS